MRVLLALLVFMPTSVFACYVSPVEAYVPTDELIQRTENIILVQAVGAEYIPPPKWEQGTNEAIEALKVGDEIKPVPVYYPVKYKLTVIETLKGDMSDNVQVLGLRSREELTHNLDLHADENFLSNPTGRLGHAPDCKVYTSFALGGYYLAFVDKPYHIKSFEYLGADLDRVYKDKWLLYVRDKTQ